MKQNLKQHPHTTVNGSAVGVRATGRVGKWFHRRDDEERSRELSLRLEERLRERARIAREFHDTVLQGFLSASLQLHSAVEQLPADSPGRSSLCRVLLLMQRVIGEGRDALTGLRSFPIESTSLEQALSALREELVPEGPACFRLFVKGEPQLLDPDTQEHLYRVGREALVNALHHSEATNIEAEVEYSPRRVRVIVRDNGRGIDPEMARSGRAAHWGLAGMRERADAIGAKLRIWSRPGAGTEVEISAPVELVATACA
jgi:signal transduction histidine kinase